MKKVGLELKAKQNATCKVMIRPEEESSLMKQSEDKPLLTEK